MELRSFTIDTVNYFLKPGVEISCLRMPKMRCLYTSCNREQKIAIGDGFSESINVKIEEL